MTPEHDVAEPVPPPAAAADVPGMAETLRILGDETRLKILWALSGGEKDVSAIWGSLGMPQPKVSHHLALLRLGRLATARRAGKRVYYSLGPAASMSGPDTIRVECPHFALTLEARDRRPPEET